jgi:ribosomal protein S18 acetylase RimI-like enzyme
MNIVLRAARSEDYEAVCALYTQLESLHAQALPHYFRPLQGPTRSRAWFAALLTNEHAAMFVGEDQQALIGLVNCSVRTTPDVPVVAPRRFVHIEDLVVSESARHQGVGQLLTEHVHRWADKQGIKEVELDVWEFPTSALGFYEQLGYQTIRRHMRRHVP